MATRPSHGKGIEFVQKIEEEYRIGPKQEDNYKIEIEKSYA